MKYQVVFIGDSHRGMQTIGKPFATAKNARRKADQLDLHYGAYRHRVVQLTHIGA